MTKLRCTMPLIEVKATDRRFADPAAVKRLIEELTDAACKVWGEDARPSISVVVEPIPATHWGVGGEPLG
jgi:4-oxalocrotonate tautomerase family enzyme